MLNVNIKNDIFNIPVKQKLEKKKKHSRNTGWVSIVIH